MGTAQLTEWDLDNDQAASGGVDLVVDFDPKSLALTYSPTGLAQGSSTTASGTYNESPTQQTSQATSLSLELLFDTSADGTTVQAKTDPIVSLTQPAPLGDQAPARKVVRLSWGTFLFYGTITSLSQTIEPSVPQTSRNSRFLRPPCICMTWKTPRAPSDRCRRTAP